MTVNFWWVRHGPTHAKSFIGHTDIPADLSDQNQLDWLMAKLPTSGSIYSSDLLRTVETAKAIADGRAMPAPLPMFREMNFGEWEAREFADVAASDPDLARQFWEQPGDVAPPSGESWNIFSKRIHQAIDDIMRETNDKNIIIVAHFGVILAALQRAAKIAPTSVFSFKIDNLSLSKFSFEPKSKQWTVGAINQKL